MLRKWVRTVREQQALIAQWEDWCRAISSMGYITILTNNRKMIKITISPILSSSADKGPGCEVVGSIKKVKILGITILTKVIEMPNKYGLREWGHYSTD